jgi:undecaprenyl diphosphate synthase
MAQTRERTRFSMNIPMLSAIGRRHSTGSAPSHVAFIAEGVERWSTQRDISYGQVLTRSLNALRCVVSAAIQFNIHYLTIDFRSATSYFAKGATDGDTKLFRRMLKECFRDLIDQGASLRVKGGSETYVDSRRIDPGNFNIKLMVYLEYDAREEISEAVRRLAQEVVSGYMPADAIDVNAISANIYGSDLPDPDLIIGTSRDQRLANFLLWQAAYAEFYFLPIDWPDFDQTAFEMAIQDYARRHRRFGGR